MSARPYSTREELAHSATHGIGVLASLIGIACLIVTAALYGDVWRVLGGVAFGATAVLVFSTSTLYHAARAPHTKALLRKLDHSAIYLLIAGTYSAFTLGAMRDTWGWALFGIVWSLALFGVIAELAGRGGHPIRSSLLYLAMGWLGIIALKPLLASLTPSQLGWVLAGGVLYTCGVPFYIWKSRPYTHLIWHLFVLAGVGCHFMAVLSVMRMA